MLSLKKLEQAYFPIWKENRKNREDCQEKMAKRDKILHIRRQINQGVAYQDTQSNREQWEKCEVDISVLQIDITAAWKKECKTWKQMDSVLFVNRSNTTYKKIDNKERRALEREPCAICYDIHGAKRLTTTSCGHTFCRPCFSKVLETNYFDDKEISCPYCRNDRITLSRYYK